MLLIVVYKLIGSTVRRTFIVHEKTSVLFLIVYQNFLYNLILFMDYR